MGALAPDVAHFANLILAGVLLGNELATLAVVHPAMRTLTVPAQVAAEQSLTRRFGVMMPFLMSATLASGIVVSACIDSDGRPLAIPGSACVAAMLAITFIGNMPVNLFTLRASPDVDPAEWNRQRRRWDRFHVARVILDAAALALFVLALLKVA
jgi:uncharacterized membrane protein